MLGKNPKVSDKKTTIEKGVYQDHGAQVNTKTWLPLHDFWKMIITKDCYACSKVLCKVRISSKLSGTKQYNLKPS